MKVVVADATGRIGSRSVTRLRDHGAQVVPLSRALGVDAGDAHALGRALRGTQILVDVADAPSRQQDHSTAFFGDTTRSLLTAARKAGVEHYVAPVRRGRRPRRLGLPPGPGRTGGPRPPLRTAVFPGARHPVLRVRGERRLRGRARGRGARSPAAAAGRGRRRRRTLAHAAVAVPLFGVLEAAGPEERPFEDFAADVLAAQDRVTPVIGDAQTPFFGALIGERTLMPGPDAPVGHHTLAQWLKDR